jgi:hypothetical protein
MATMIAMLDRFGPDAKRRAAMETQDMQLKQQGFGLQQQQQAQSSDYMKAQIAAMQANQARMEQDAQREQEQFTFDQQQRAALAPIQQASASAGLAQILQQQAAAAQQQEIGAFDFEQKQKMAPLGLTSMALENVNAAQMPAMRQQAMDAETRMREISMLGEQAAYVKTDPRVRVAPDQLQRYGFEQPPAPDVYLQDLQAKLFTNPQAALAVYEAAGPQLQQMLPLSPEMKISLASGILPPELARMFAFKGQPVSSQQSPDVYAGYF